MNRLGKPEVRTDVRTGPKPLSELEEIELTPLSTPATASMDPQVEMRREFVRLWRRHVQQRDAAEAAGLLPHDRGFPRFDFGPFADLRCGARGKRTGRPCPLTTVYGNGRCRFHGGLSTGPRTAEGKAIASRNAWTGQRLASGVVEGGGVGKMSGKQGT